MKDPNLFIVGAPKCGTTALVYYLKSHPDVFMSNPKEPLYFMDERDPFKKITDWRHYRSLFKNADNFSIVGEASVWYLYSSTAMRRIKNTFPNSKIIIMTREPVGFVTSLHSQLVFAGYEHEDIENAWRREKCRLEQIDVDKLPTIEFLPYWRRAYPELARHIKYAIKWKNLFGEENVLIIDLSELKENPRGVYQRILSFLNIKDDGRTDFPIINANKTHRSKVIGKILNWIQYNKLLVDFARKIKSSLGIGTLGIYAWLKKLNTKKIHRKPISYTLKLDILKTVQENSYGYV